MNCPYCNQEMKKGFINQGNVLYPIRWHPIPEKPPVLLYSNRGLRSKE